MVDRSTCSLSPNTFIPSSKLFQQFNGGGHPKAASATAKVADETEASELLQRLVNELIDKGLDKQLTVGDFMQSPGTLLT